MPKDIAQQFNDKFKLNYLTMMTLYILHAYYFNLPKLGSDLIIYNNTKHKTTFALTYY